MVKANRIGPCAGVILLGAIAFAQQPTPIADPVEKSLLPSGIMELPVTCNARLAALFEDPDGTSVMHFVGDFVLTVGDTERQELRSREAVAWIETRDFKGRSYRQLQVMLWKDAEIQELGGTRTSGPALFVTLNTFGAVTIEADDILRQPTIETSSYRDASAIRKAFLERVPKDEDSVMALRMFDPAAASAAASPPKPRPIIHFQSRGELAVRQADNGRRIITMTGGVYLARGVPGVGEYLEIQADSVVVFLSSSAALPEVAGSEPVGLGTETRAPTARGPKRERRPDPDRQLMATGFGDVEVESVYLEGDVQFTQGVNAIQASRLYYDFPHERALILDAVVRTTLVERNIPLYIRASEIRQLSAAEFTADDAILTTSEFHTPHYHVGARRVELINRTPPAPDGRLGGIRAGTFTLRDASLNLWGHPVSYWPFMRGNVDSSETAIQSIRTGFSDDFGMELEAKWDLFNVLGLRMPDGFRSSLRTDYYSERGSAIGVDADYERDRYFGTLRSYLMGDKGEDDLGRDREVPHEQDVRGRFLLRHRQYLEDDWQISLELSYLSDRTFLEEFFEPEFDNDKEQETLLYLKKQRDNWAFTALLQTRILDFLTQTERLPDFSLHLVGEPLGDTATWFSENRAGAVRYRKGHQTFRELLRDGEKIESGTTLRVDTRQEIGMPVDLGDVRLVPFVVGRGTSWDDSPESGGLTRGYAAAGVRGSMYLWRLYPEVRSTLFDIDGIRHVIKPNVTAWVSEANREKHDLFPFDETVEEIADADGVTFGVRQRFQTKRGEGENRRVVDVLTHDVEVGAFHDAESDEVTNGFGSFSRPENSISRNYVNSSTIWRLNDRTAFLSETNYDLSDGKVDVLNVSVAVERTPRMSYVIGYRFIDPTDSNVLGFDLNYRMTEKHTLALRELFDLDRGQTLDLTVALIRKFPRWFGAISFELDEAEDDFGVSLSLWPEGLPHAALGSRRFTGLANTTRLRND